MNTEFDYFQWLDLDRDAEHDLRGTEQVCHLCECAPGYMLSECPGRPLTAYQKGRVGRGRLDFKAGEWKAKITVPCFIGTFEEVTAFLDAEL